jgi:hypothetical protein
VSSHDRAVCDQIDGADARFAQFHDRVGQGQVHPQRARPQTGGPQIFAPARRDPGTQTVRLVLDATARIAMFAIAAHAAEREAHVREVERSGQTLPEGSYRRRNRQAIAARDRRAAARLRPSSRPTAPLSTATPRTRRRSPAGHSVLRSSGPAGRSTWRRSVTRQTAAINSGPGHDRPERAPACLLTGEVVAAAAVGSATDRLRLDETSRHAIDSADRPHAPSADSGPADPPEPADARDTTGTALWLALCQAPGDGTDVTGLIPMTGWPRTRLYRQRRQYAGAGRATGVSGGRCRTRRPGERSL